MTRGELLNQFFPYVPSLFSAHSGFRWVSIITPCENGGWEEKKKKGMNNHPSLSLSRLSRTLFSSVPVKQLKKGAFAVSPTPYTQRTHPLAQPCPRTPSRLQRGVGAQILAAYSFHSTVGQRKVQHITAATNNKKESVVREKVKNEIHSQTRKGHYSGRH
jgi:hypothetical protein